MNILQIINADDWQMLFVNGVLAQQNHSLTPRDLNKFTPIGDIDVICAEDIPGFWGKLRDWGQLPYGITYDKAITLGWE